MVKLAVDGGCNVFVMLQVAEMYRSQEQIVNQMKKRMDVDADDDMEWRDLWLNFASFYRLLY